LQGVDFAKYTSLSTGTTKIALNSGAAMVVPSGAKQIRSVSPQLAPTTITPGESVAAKLTLESDDLPVLPGEYAAPVIATILGATGQVYVPPSPVYQINVPTVGGERWTPNGTALKANTAGPLMGCAVIYDTEEPEVPIMHGKVGTYTQFSAATGGTETEDATQMTINGGSMLEAVYCIVGPRALAAAQPHVVRGKIVSSDIKPPFPLTFSAQPIGGVLGALGSLVNAGIHIHDIALALAPASTLKLSAILDNTVNTAPDFSIGVLYT